MRQEAYEGACVEEMVSQHVFHAVNRARRDGGTEHD